METNELIAILRYCASNGCIRDGVDEPCKFGIGNDTSDCANALLTEAADRIAATVDAVPMVHGRWELVDEAEPRRYKRFRLFGCSECSCLSWYGTYKYCPNCGARMDGGDVDG